MYPIVDIACPAPLLCGAVHSHASINRRYIHQPRRICQILPSGAQAHSDSNHRSTTDITLQYTEPACDVPIQPYHRRPTPLSTEVQLRHEMMPSHMKKHNWRLLIKSSPWSMLTVMHFPCIGVHKLTGVYSCSRVHGHAGYAGISEYDTFNTDEYASLYHFWTYWHYYVAVIHNREYFA